MNKKLTPENNKIAYHCRKLKRDETISKIYTSSETNIIFCNILENGKPQKFIMSMIFALMFPDINFSNYDNDYSSNPANESLQFSYKWSK